ncbi:ABC transporter ATP-binding protein [Devosia sediminis]|uniref:ABC transporter ATP-binding protein n=1 Tax=Devosia sediminis TaxID=2798801 RepID=A0A934IUF8_9HYPH|nr:ABC transporter ATP-binding protein [Devosia sediminis]MBJ3784552.1 ABC transporter ATP-binding protein [Devosia sediminis]
MTAAVSIRDLDIELGFGASRRLILDGVALDVPQGACFGLVGESGSGKSTVLRCIALLLRGWSGDIDINGRPVRDIPRAEYCRQVQMVFQDPYGSLHPRQSVATALFEPLRTHKLDRHQERAEAALADVGLPGDFLYRYPHELSGGQRQRVAIARALILDPSILLLDEPTSALDVSVQAEVLNLLSDLRTKRGLTYLLVSHDLAVIDHLCDQFAVMQHGRLLEVLPREAIANLQVTNDYSRSLIQASLDYDRAI